MRPEIFWATSTRIKLSCFCSTLMNFQKFRWHDNLWPSKCLWHPCTLFLCKVICCFFCGTYSTAELESLGPVVECFLDTYQCRYLHSNRVDYLHLHYRPLGRWSINSSKPWVRLFGGRNVISPSILELWANSWFSLCHACKPSSWIPLKKLEDKC